MVTKRSAFDAENELAKVAAEIDRLNDNFKKKVDAVGRVKFQGDIEQLERDLNALNANKKIAEAEYKDFQRKINTLRADKGASEAAFAELQAEIEQLTANLNTLRAKATKTGIAKLQADTERLKKNLSKKFADIGLDKIRRDIDTLRETFTNLREAKVITEEGRVKLQEEIDKLSEDLKKLRENKASAYTQTGDTWHDNPYFNQLEREEGRLLIQIGEIQNTLKMARVIDNSVRSQDSVEIGSIFKCTYTYPGDDDAEEAIYEIVGQGETDVENGKIHYESPVAKNLIGHRLNETVAVNTPIGKVSYKIVKLYSSWDEAKAEA